MKIDKLMKMVSGGKSDVTYPELVEVCRLMLNAAVAIEQGDRVARRMFSDKDYAEVIEMQRAYLGGDVVDAEPAMAEAVIPAAVEDKPKKK